MQVSVKNLPKSEVEIEGELEAEIFEAYFNSALKKLGENIKLDGFRKGKVPESVLLSAIPEINILEEMAEMALGEHYPKIIEDQKIDAISRPEIMITKLARNNPLGFKIKTAVMPKIKLPDYKKIAEEILKKITTAEKNIAVTEEDLENTIMDIRKSRAKKVHMAEGVESHVHSNNEKKETTEDLPEFNDNFVQELGPFKDVTDFKNKLKENIRLEKENQSKEKTRIKIVEKIIEDSEVDVPEILTGLELDKILYKMESDITQMGLKFEDYLKHINKTVEDLRKEFRNDGEKKAKLALILDEIAKIEKIVANEEQVEKEIATILEHYKDADKERARAHVENVLINEKVFQLLENL